MIGSMRNRYSKILCLLLLFACCLPQEGNAFWPFKKKKKEDKKENHIRSCSRIRKFRQHTG